MTVARRRVPSRVPAASRKPRAIATPQDSETRDPEADENALAFFRAYLENAADDEPIETVDGPRRRRDHPALVVARRAIDAVERYAAARGRADRDARAAVMRRALLRHSFLRQKTIHNWFPYIRDARIAWQPCTCWACGAPARTAVVSLALAGADPRRLLSCARCGLVEDVDARSTLRFAVHANDLRVRLSGELPHRGWNAALQLRSPTPAYRRAWTWPTASDGRPVRTWQSPAPWPPGPMHVAFVLVRNTTFDSLATAIHRG